MGQSKYYAHAVSKIIKHPEHKQAAQCSYTIQ